MPTIVRVFYTNMIIIIVVFRIHQTIVLSTRIAANCHKDNCKSVWTVSTRNARKADRIRRPDCLPRSGSLITFRFCWRSFCCSSSQKLLGVGISSLTSNTAPDSPDKPINILKFLTTDKICIQVLDTNCCVPITVQTINFVNYTKNIEYLRKRNTPITETKMRTKKSNTLILIRIIDVNTM